MLKKLRDWIVEKFHKLLQIHDTPHAIAGAVAIGIFFSFTPLFGFRILLALAFAWIFRCSKIAAVIAVNLHEIVFFLWPLVLRFEYQIGFWLMNHRLPPKLRDHHWNIYEWFKWKTWAHVGEPMLLGSLVIGVPIAVASFFIAEKVVRTYRHRKAMAAAGSR